MTARIPEQVRTKKTTKQRIFLLVFLAIVVMLVGFVIGRGTGRVPEIEVPTGGEQTPGHEWTDLPPLPKDTTEVDENTNPIIIESPAENTKVPRTFNVTGRASTTLKTLTVSLKDEKGVVLSKDEVNIAALASTAEKFARFTVQLSSGDYQGAAKIEIESSSANVAVRRAVTVADPDTVTINVYFGKKTTGNVICEQVYPISRVVSAKSSVYREAVESLLAGLSPSETALGYFTSIPNGVRVKSLAVDANGVLTVDFDGALDRGVAGSCRVGAIRSQIETTLKQFPEVRSVIIMVDGNADEALQP